MIPRLLNSGNYDPVALRDYLAVQRDRNIPNHEIATELNVPQDRVVYALGLGWPMIERRAEIARLARIGAAQEAM